MNTRMNTMAAAAETRHDIRIIIVGGAEGIQERRAFCCGSDTVKWILETCGIDADGSIVFVNGVDLSERSFEAMTISQMEEQALISHNFAIGVYRRLGKAC